MSQKWFEKQIDYIWAKLELVKNSQNPFLFWWNILSIKEDFSKYIEDLTDELVSSFKTNNEFLVSVYKDAQYERVWLKILENYIQESAYFDPLQFFKFWIILNKEKQVIVKWIIKLKKWENEENIKKLLEIYNFDKKLIDKIQKIYKNFKIDKLQIDKKYLDENHPEKILEKIYIQLNDFQKYSFASNFKPDIDYVKENINNESYFKEFYSILKDIFSIFSNSKNKFSFEYIKTEVEKKQIIDTQIKLYKDFKIKWYEQLLEIFENNNISGAEKWYFMQYIKKSIVENYFPEIKKILYFYDGNIDYKIYNFLKWWIDKETIERSRYYDLYEKLFLLKDLIKKLYNSVFGPFIRPFVIDKLAYSLKLSNNDLLKLRYILWFLLSDNFLEFRNVYTFINEIISVRENISTLLKIYFINFTLVAIVLILLWIVSPFLFAMASTLFVGRLIYLYLAPIKKETSFNWAINSFLILALAVWGYAFVKNYDNYTKDTIKPVIEKTKEVIWYRCKDISVCNKIWTSILDVGSDILGSFRK